MIFAEYMFQNMAAFEGYTHCFFVAGGNSMHLLNAARKLFTCIPVVNEVAAGIAVEYFNEVNPEGKKAFVLVTAGPGLTNLVTAVAGAYLESRELLVIGGQVKTQDLKEKGMRQRGIQEIDGVSILSPITNKSLRLMNPIEFSALQEILHGFRRPGPIFIEIPLDVQATEISDFPEATPFINEEIDSNMVSAFVEESVSQISKSTRPVILLGGGVRRETAARCIRDISLSGIPVMTTWNGADRYAPDLPNFWGRPNTWGQRAANILIQQSDFIIAVGTRLGLQQTGFAWEQFAPLAKIFQVEIDPLEVSKGHPRIDNFLVGDANSFLPQFARAARELHFRFDDWIAFGESVWSHFELSEASNVTGAGYVNPYEFVLQLSDCLTPKDVIIPCSSGGAFTVTMQAFVARYGQKIVSNKGLASMGYGLAGAIGAALSSNRRTILIEGDGGFAQNLQELGTVARQNLNIKIFIFSNRGYASIRMTQKNYFGGAYMGCDIETGLGLPDWEYIAKSYGIEFFKIESEIGLSKALNSCVSGNGPVIVEVIIDPNQTYYPKISSRILENGQMASNPLHLMSPELNDNEVVTFLPYLEIAVKTAREEE